jgi:hypothetical protein
LIFRRPLHSSIWFLRGPSSASNHILELLNVWPSSTKSITIKNHIATISRLHSPSRSLCKVLPCPSIYETQLSYSRISLIMVRHLIRSARLSIYLPTELLIGDTTRFCVGSDMLVYPESDMHYGLLVQASSNLTVLQARCAQPSYARRAFLRASSRTDLSE